MNNAWVRFEADHDGHIYGLLNDGTVLPTSYTVPWLASKNWITREELAAALGDVARNEPSAVESGDQG